MLQFTKLKEKIKDKALPYSEVNEDKELIIINQGEDEFGYYLSVSTVQSNGWLRINHF